MENNSELTELRKLVVSQAKKIEQLESRLEMISTQNRQESDTLARMENNSRYDAEVATLRQKIQQATIEAQGASGKRRCLFLADKACLEGKLRNLGNRI